MFSQNSEFEFGLKAGANLSKYTSDFEAGGAQNIDFERKTGFYLGGFLNYELSDLIALQPELLFASLGTETSFNLDNLNSPDPSSPVFEGELKKRTIDYTLLLPLLVQFKPGEKFYFEAGPQLGFIISRNDKIIETSLNEAQNGLQSEGEDYDSFSAAAAVGVGYFLTEQLSLNARYFHELSKRDILEVQASVFNLGLSYHFL